MLLCNLHIIGKKGLQDIQVTEGKITAVTEGEKYSINSKENQTQIEFADGIAFQGLINSHDHLDFNLFPQTGNRIYNNYAEWGKDIHVKNKQAINAVLKIPQHLRTQWGLYKNLLNGVTTVVNHGEKLNIKGNMINVIQSANCLHSTQFEKNWRWKLNRVFTKNQPFVIHIGEGTDNASQDEIDELIKWNLFKKKLIGVHGVAMDDQQAASFKALIWCPASNNFLLNSTAIIDELKTKTTILFGTDSTLTASWNMWEQLRMARDTLLLTDEELFESLTKNAATIWKRNDIVSIDINKQADIIIANANNKTGFDAFYSINPKDIQLILRKGEILLFDEEIKNQLPATKLSFSAFNEICIDGQVKYIYGDIRRLTKEILSYYPDAFFPFSAPACTTR
jgi:cytosine/adenosine deaminase-related metal-dependent hydrolase